MHTTAPVGVAASPRATSTKTRIETFIHASQGYHFIKVRGRLPRKQGLKQCCWQEKKQGLEGPRATSTKTRIETSCPALRCFPVSFCPRATSTKTIIETDFSSNEVSFYSVRGRVPRKKVLRCWVPGILLYEA